MIVFRMNTNRMPVLTASIALAACLFAGVTDGQGSPSIMGTASVIDGDTIDIHGARIRLDAIDAPESSQLCLNADGANYGCGQNSAFPLAVMLVCASSKLARSRPNTLRQTLPRVAANSMRHPVTSQDRLRTYTWKANLESSPIAGET